MRSVPRPVAAIACVALARPTQSRALVAQACGRGLRPHESKSEAVILDFVGVACRHSLVGPEDVLGGALVEVPAARSAPARDVAMVPAYLPIPAWAARWVARVVELAGAAARVAVREVRRAPTRARRWFTRVVDSLIGQSGT